ncbi:MAG: ubiquinol-cytochrome c reductase iron-sulfur subunit [Pseudomonadales bacterium]|nr:ubiquinol-cytochrome c reductase iron-sulfur subunit [Pseudomonadales bacterium]
MDHSGSTRRQFLIASTAFLAGGAVVGVAVPFVKSWSPSAKAKTAGAPITFDTQKLEPGQLITLEWQGKPVWVLKRTQQNLEHLKKTDHKTKLSDPDSNINQQPQFAENDYRSLKPDIFVAIGICTHLGCVPLYEKTVTSSGENPLFFCPCHGSKFDLSGRVYKNVPAPTNLIIPPYIYLTDTVIEIGQVV